jgi:hypothetical protein
MNKSNKFSPEIASGQRRMADRNLSGRAIGRQFHRAETPKSSLTSRAGLLCLIAPQGVSARRIESTSRGYRIVTAQDLDLLERRQAMHMPVAPSGCCIAFALHWVR